MGLAEFPGFDVAMRRRLDAAIDRLAEEFADMYDPEAVAEVVDESARRLSAGGITPFVHILTERFARERLRAPDDGAKRRRRRDSGFGQARRLAGQ